MSVFSLSLAVQPVEATETASVGPLAEDLVVSTLLTNLEYPKGLWIEEDAVYLTETAQRNTVFGGKLCLDLFNITTGQKTILVNDPIASDAAIDIIDRSVHQ